MCNGAGEVPGQEGEPAFIPCPCGDGFEARQVLERPVVDAKRSLELAVEALERELERTKAWVKRVL